MTKTKLQFSQKTMTKTNLLSKLTLEWSLYVFMEDSAEEVKNFI